MAHTHSALKRHRQSTKLRLRNKSTKNTIKTYLKKIEKSVAEGRLGAAREELVSLQKRLDKAASRRILHPNAANRLKSRWASRVAALEKKDAKTI